MSAITFEQVKHLASLALIEMTDEELTAMASELDIIVASVETMSQEALSGAPDAQDGKFRVPAILDED